MLLSFHIENYKSILNVTIPLNYAEKKAPNGYKEMDLYPFIEENECRMVPVLAFYGANASGKSNIIKAFGLFIKIIRGKYYCENFEPNKIHNNENPIVFEIAFVNNGIKCSYTLKFNENEIVYENLKKENDNIILITKEKHIFDSITTDTYSFEKLESIYSVECMNSDNYFQTPFLKILAKNYAGLNSFVSNSYNFLSRNIEVYQSNNVPLTFSLEKLAKTNLDNSIQVAFDEMIPLLKKLDIDIIRMEIKQNKIKESTAIDFRKNHEFTRGIKTNKIKETQIKSFHKDINGNEVIFDFYDESIGTQRVASILCIVLSILKEGKILIIDELGNSLHPFIFVEIVKLFKDKRYNKNNAQLIFTTHNTDIMDDDMMRISELCVVEKTLKKGTILKRFSDYEGIRNITSFRKQYLEGRLSGIPYPYI